MWIDVDLLCSSFRSLVAPRTQEFSDRLYDRLFQRHPELEQLFRSPMEWQKRHFVNALTIIVSSLRHPAGAADLLKTLGGVHAGYGVQAEHYPLMGENLVAVLREMAGETWTPGLEQAWSDAYQVVQGLIYEGLVEAVGSDAGRGSPCARAAGDSGTGPLPNPSESDPLALASEYIELSRHWREGAAMLSIAEMERWRELRETLENLLDAEPPPGRTRRRFLRVPTRLGVEFTERVDSAKGVLTQIGEGGIFIATERPPERGTRIRLGIVQEPKADRLEVEGIVAWARRARSAAGPPGMGVRFTNLDGRRRAEILDLIERSLFLVLSRDERYGTLGNP